MDFVAAAGGCVVVALRVGASTRLAVFVAPVVVVVCRACSLGVAFWVAVCARVAVIATVCVGVTIPSAALSVAGVARLVVASSKLEPSKALAPHKTANSKTASPNKREGLSAVAGFAVFLAFLLLKEACAGAALAGALASRSDFGAANVFEGVVGCCSVVVVALLGAACG